jgi:plastocyanin
MFLRAGVFAAIVAVVVTVNGGALAANQSVTALGSNQFSPADVTVNVGEMVTFSNGSGLHNVHFDDGSFDQPSSPSTSGWSYPRTFNTVGDFRYYCEQHGGPNGSGMSGIVHVVAAPPGPPPPSPPPPSPPPPGGNPPGQNPPGGGPAPTLPALKVTLKVSDATPLAGQRVRIFGVVKPARDGRKLQIQKRLRSGAFKTIATTKLQDAGAAKSVFSLRLKLAADAVLRARVAGDDERATGLSRTKKVDVHRP